MSESPTPVARSISPLWILLLLPAAPAIGWLVGQTPVPRSVEAKPAAQPGEQPSQTPAPRQHTSDPPVGTLEIGHIESAPAQPEKPAPESPSTEFSSWTSLDNALAESRRNGKPILIDFSADWCGPCQSLKREVFEDSDYGPLVQKAVIPVSIVDRRREEGSNPPGIVALYQRYGVNAFPTVIVFSPASGRTMRTQGFGDADETATWIAQAAKAVR